MLCKACIRIQVWDVTLWYSAVMAVYRSDQMPTATVSSQELLAFTLKLASWQAVSLHSVGSLISGHNISMKESSSKEEVSAIHFVLDAFI